MNLIKLTPEEKEIINITSGNVALYLSYGRKSFTDDSHMTCVELKKHMAEVDEILQRNDAEDSDLVANYFTDDDTFKSVKDIVEKKFTGNSQEDISLLICGSFLDAVNTNLQATIKNAVLDNIDDPLAAVALITDAVDHAAVARFMALAGLKRYLQAME